MNGKAKRITFLAYAADIRWLEAKAKANHTTVSQLLRAIIRGAMETKKGK